jgi:hypothetical protein
MTPTDEGLSSVITYSEHLALEGLEEQWRKGDSLALVEAVTICGKEGNPYPEWVCKILSEAMTKLYEAVYSTEGTINCNGISVSHQLMHNEDEFSWQLERARDQLLVSIGLSADRDNAGKIRKRLLRDAYLAELVAQMCNFIPTPQPKFKGFSPAFDKLAVMLKSDEEEPDRLKRFPQECWDAKHDTIKRAWQKHKDKLTSCYTQNPCGPIVSLDWYLGYNEADSSQD